MSESKKPPVKADALPPEWPEIVRKVVVRDGYAVRGNGILPIIEIKSLTTNQWFALALPGGGTTFVSFDDRNLILNKIR